MTTLNTYLTPELESYLLQQSQFDNNDLDDLFNSAYYFDEPTMQISKLQATALQFIIQNNNIKNVIEIGTFVGYSASCMAKAMTKGKLVTIEINKAHYEKARQNFYDDISNKPAYLKKIELIHGDAKDVFLQKTIQFSKADLIFLDGDKVNYDFYLDWVTKHMKKNAYFVIDNALMKSGVISQKDNQYVAGILKLINTLKKSNAFNYFFLPIGDCMIIARKK